MVGTAVSPVEGVVVEEVETAEALAERVAVGHQSAEVKGAPESVVVLRGVRSTAVEGASRQCESHGAFPTDGARSCEPRLRGTRDRHSRDSCRISEHCIPRSEHHLHSEHGARTQGIAGVARVTLGDQASRLVSSHPPEPRTRSPPTAVA